MDDIPRDRQEAERSQPDSIAMYRAAIETSADGFWLSDAEGRILEVNNAYVKQSGYTREELLTMKVTDLEVIERPGETAAHIAKVMCDGYDLFETLHRAKDGTTWQVEINVSYQAIDGGRFFCFLRNITQRKQAESEFLNREQQLQALSTNLAEGMVYQINSGPDGQQRQFTYVSPAVETLHGLTVEEVKQDPGLLYGQVIEEDRALVAERELHAFATKTKLEVDVRVRIPSGDIRWRRFISSPRLAPNGCWVWDGIELDITERKRAEEAVKKSEKMLQTIIETEPECVKLLDENANLIMMNRAGLDMIQADTMDQVKGQCICPLVTADYREPFMDLNKRVFQGGTGTLLFEVVGMKGRHLWLETHAVPLRNDKNEIFALLGVTRDVTDRKRAEEALRQSEEFVRGILDTVDEGFIVIDRDYRILTANKAYCIQVGGCDEKIIGSHCYEISHKIDRPCFEEGEECATRQTFETGTPHTALHRHKDANGNILYVETKAFPIKDAAGKVTSVIETINNITEKYLLEEERLKTQKLESIGTLAGGIAHDFNNLLQGVFGYIVMAKITHDQKEKSLAMLDQAEEALHMSVNLTTQLLTFSKGGKPVKKLIRLEPVIENAVKFALSGSHTDYLLDTAPDLWSVEADAGQLAQVIQNIVLNANEAMAGRGTVAIEVKNMDIPPKTNLRLPDGGRFVRIDIQDTGTGISRQNIAKIFDPYFTTKQRGSGLGLATSYSIIKNHGGLIEVESEINRGTTFTIYLPASKEAEVKVGATAPAAEGTKKGRILLMDDEDLVRTVADQMIAALGHYVVSTEDGEKAIDLFREAKKKGRPFDLVILDLTVKGGMGGEEAIATLREIDPNVTAVVSSGYADNRVVADYRAYGFSGVLNKPYRLDDLKSCLNLFFS